MSEPKQSLANHARFVPLFHGVCFGLILVNLVHSALRLLHDVSADRLVAFGLAVALVLLAWFARVFALTVQDRVIRLELSLRVQRLAPELAGRFAQLTPGQFTALRFAGDAELPGLLREVLEGKLVRGADIKKRITDWQPDHLRA